VKFERDFGAKAAEKVAESRADAARAVDDEITGLTRSLCENVQQRRLSHSAAAVEHDVKALILDRADQLAQDLAPPGKGLRLGDGLRRREDASELQPDPVERRIARSQKLIARIGHEARLDVVFHAVRRCRLGGGRPALERNGSALKRRGPLGRSAGLRRFAGKGAKHLTQPAHIIPNFRIVPQARAGRPLGGVTQKLQPRLQ
jgi:hypothetical protein